MAEPGTIEALLAKSKALLDAVTFDENGAMVAGQWVGGNGGMVSRQTIVAAHALRLELSGWKKSVHAKNAHTDGITPEPSSSGPLLAKSDESGITDIGPRDG